jgi:ribosomal protein S18 acetylase RimI-like enzyme
MDIRQFHRDDTESVVALWTRCELTRPWNDPYKDIDRKLAEDPSLFLVGELVQSLVGTVMAGFDGHRGWIYYLAVDPGCRGYGYGRALMARAESQLLERGCSKVNLMVRASNDEVLAFYGKLGYERQDVVTLGRRLVPD